MTARDAAAPAAANPPDRPLPFRGALLSVPKREEGTPPDFPEISDPKKRAYLVALASTPKLEDAARAAGIDPRTGWNYRHDTDDAAFQRWLPVARTLGVERAIGEAWRRAIEGVEKPVYQGGRLVGTVREYSDTMLIFLLKGEMPEKYRERLEHSGPGGGPIQNAVQLYIPDNQRHDRGTP